MDSKTTKTSKFYFVNNYKHRSLFFIFYCRTNVHVYVLPNEYADVNVFSHHENAYVVIFLNVNKQ